MRLSILKSRLTGRGILILSALTLLALAPSASAQVPTWFGYYNGHHPGDNRRLLNKVMPFEDPNDVAERQRQFDYTNFLHMPTFDPPGPPDQDPRLDIAQAAALGYKIILDAGARFTFHCCGDANWEADTDELGNWVALIQDHILAIQLVDEPYTATKGAGGPPIYRTQAEQEALVDYVRDRLLTEKGVDVPLMISYSQSNLGVATNLDLVAVSYYVNVMPDPNSPPVMTDFTTFDTELDAKIGDIKTQVPGMPIFLIGDTHQQIGLNPPALKKLRPTLAQQQWYFDYASAEPAITGLWMFILTGGGGTGPLALGGAYDDPNIVPVPPKPSLELHSQWGAQVLAQQNLPNPNIFDRHGGLAGGPYPDQAAVNLVYVPSSSDPQREIDLSFDRDFGEEDGSDNPIGPPNGPASYGASLEFGKGQENAVRTFSQENRKGEVSLWMWIGPNFNLASPVPGAHGYVIGVGNTNNKRMRVTNNGGEPFFKVGDDNGAGSGIVTGIEHKINRWHNLRWVFNGLGVAVYINAQLVYENPAGWPTGFNHLHLGDGWGGGIELDEQLFLDDLKVTWDSSFTCLDIWASGQGIPGDIDRNCRVDLGDFGRLHGQWMVDYTGGDPNSL